MSVNPLLTGIDTHDWLTGSSISIAEPGASGLAQRVGHRGRGGAVRSEGARGALVHVAANVARWRGGRRSRGGRGRGRGLACGGRGLARGGSGRRCGG